MAFAPVHSFKVLGDDRDPVMIAVSTANALGIDRGAFKRLLQRFKKPRHVFRNVCYLSHSFSPLIRWRKSAASLITSVLGEYRANIVQFSQRAFKSPSRSVPRCLSFRISSLWSSGR